MNDMNVTCADRERIFMDGCAEEWTALETHAANCAECGEELLIWKSMSSAAGDLQRDWETPYLWTKIERGLAEQMSEKPSRWRVWLNSLGMSVFHWQTAGAMALLVVVTGSAIWWISHRGSEDPTFIRVSEVERAEAVYEKAIDKLAAQAQPVLDGQATPLMASYREKLLVLDNAIDELRAEAGQNPANAHLRRQLLAMYQEKQDTLEEVLGAKK
ncbi:MAG TPA: hypothetical protein VFP96_15095 [Candidatus Acidoferrum sp.]|nr:hypothetical protein [Candidatus Acidoferrum sp.]